MKKSNKVLSAVAAGVLGVMGAAYAYTNVDTANLTVYGILDVKDEPTDHQILGRLKGGQFLPNKLNVEGGVAHIGSTATYQALLTLNGKASTTDGGGKLTIRDGDAQPDWNLQNSDGDLAIFTNSGSDRDVEIENDNASYVANLRLNDGDLYFADGGIIFEQATTKDAVITSNSDGDVIIQLGS